MSSVLRLQAENVKKDHSITQLSARITQAEKDRKKAVDQFQEEKTLLTNREAELLKAKADVRPRHDCMERSNDCHHCLAVFAANSILHAPSQVPIACDCVIKATNDCPAA